MSDTTTTTTTTADVVHDYFRSRIDSDEQMQADVEFACNCGHEYAYHIARLFDRPTPVDGFHLPDLTGLSLLELGPGMNFGPMLVCLAAGADSITVADKYLVKWHATYHPQFYAQFLEHAATRFKEVDWQPLAGIDQGDNELQAQVRQWSFDIATLDSLDDLKHHSFDAIVSNAVLEHIEDMQALANRLFDMTNPGGVGIHQVDFRDHSHAEEPLEFLKIDNESYAAMFRESLGGGGNRVRPHELEAMFSWAGFDALQFDANAFANDEYVTRVQPKLIERFKAMSFDQLRIVGGRQFIRRRRQ